MTPFDFLIACTLVAFVVIILAIVRDQMIRYRRANSQHTIFQVIIPQYSGTGDSTTHKQGETPKDRLSAVENLFSVLAATKSQKGLRAFLMGRDDHFTVEMVNIRGTIHFYAALPSEYLGQLFIQQIHSVYPHAQLRRVPDYNIFQPQSTILGGYLTFRKNFIFPIKTYRSMENDPLENLTTSLGRIPADGGAAIQLVLRSTHPSWHAKGRRVIDDVYKGKSLKDAVTNNLKERGALATIGKILSAFFSIFGASFSSQKPKSDQQKLPTQQQLSPKDQEAIKGIEDKISKAGFDANIRIVVSLPNRVLAEQHMRSLMDAFGEFNIYEYGNAFKPLYFRNQDKIVSDFIYRNFEAKAQFIINAEETTSLFHLPESIHSPKISWLKAKKMPPPTDLPSEGILLGTNSYRETSQAVRIKDPDRRRHMYIIGQTGVGKSVFINNMAIQDIRRGKGVCVIDPHGDLIDSILGSIPQERIDDVVLFNPADTDRPVALNMLEYDSPEQKTFVINEMINIFDKLYDLRQTGGPMFEQYMRNAMLLVMDDPESGSTLLEIPKVLADQKFRKYKLSKSTNAVVRDFWEKEAQKAGGEAALANMVPYITSKLTQFVANDTMRAIIAQQHSSFNFRKIMDEQKILLINLSKGRIGDMNSSLLGLIIVGKILMAALSRATIAEHERKDFYLYIDEFQNYVSPSISIILSEARKYKLNLILAHQYIGQLVKNNDTSVRDAVFGNVGTMVAFRIGSDDAEIMSEQFAPTVDAYDLMNIEKYNAYIRLLIDNQNIAPFSFSPEAPLESDQKIAVLIKQLSRKTYGRPREDIEREIIDRTRVELSTENPLPPVP